MWRVPRLRPSVTNLRASILKREPGPFLVPGAYDALSAKLLDLVGFDTIYLSTLGTALAQAGLPDAGLFSGAEHVRVARHVAETVTAAVIVDADDGYGNAINVMRTVRDLIAAGAAGIELNDQAGPGVR